MFSIEHTPQAEAELMYHKIDCDAADAWKR